jgi:hypothetical protein
MKILHVFLTSCIFVSAFSFAQDSVKVKNRHDIPDTVRDTVKLKGGALIDTIHSKPDKDMMKKPDSSSSSKTNLWQFMAYAQDERNEKIAALENGISDLKKNMDTKNVSYKSAVATVENKKNELKSTLKNNPNMSEKDRQIWDNNYKELILKVNTLKSGK